MTPPTVAGLVAAGRIEQVDADQVVGWYAAERIPDASGSDAIAAFQRLRRRRNRSEYDDVLLGLQDVLTDIAVASEIVASVEAALASM